MTHSRTDGQQADGAPTDVRPAARRVPHAGLWWRAAAVMVACGVALLLAVAISVFLLRFTADAQQAMLALRAARPWLVALQIGALGWLWHGWSGVVTWIGRWRPMAPALQKSLLQGRPRIFLLLAAGELLIVLRALTEFNDKT